MHAKTMITLARFSATHDPVLNPETVEATPRLG